MTKKQKSQKIIKLLNKNYPLTKCYLNYDKPYELLIATILSAQCTDDRVNLVTPKLFKKYPSIESFAVADLHTLENDIRSTGFYRMKAKNIILSMQKLLTEYNSEMPSDIDILTTFAGVGRKTANVIRGHIFNIPSIVVDTHVKRVSNKLGLCSSSDPKKIEFELMEILQKKYWIQYNTQIIAHGRSLCKARAPLCKDCFLSELCDANLRIEKIINRI